MKIMRVQSIKVFVLLSVLTAGTGCKDQYLTGYYNREEFIQQCKWKRTVNDRYRPRNPEYLDSLKKLPKNVDVKLFLGTWCSDSRKWVPRFFQIQNDLPVRKLEIIAVDTTKKDERSLWRTYKIDSVPTFLFFREDKLIGRLNVKPPKKRLEKALYRILKPH